MKKFFAAVSMVVFTIFIGVTSLPAVSANAIGNPSWLDWKTGCYSYDFNNDGSIDSIDRIYAAQYWVDNKLTTTDLSNLNNLLVTGEFATPISFSEIDVDHQSISEENDNMFAEVISGKLIASFLDGPCYRFRFLKDCKVTELRSLAYSSKEAYITSNEFGICKDEYGYKFSSELLSCYNIEKFSIDNYDPAEVTPKFDGLLAITESQCGIEFYRYDNYCNELYAYTLDTVCYVNDILYVYDIIRFDNRLYVICVTNNLEYALYGGDIISETLDPERINSLDVSTVLSFYAGTPVEVQNNNVLGIKYKTFLKLYALGNAEETVSDFLTINFSTAGAKLILGLTEDNRLAWNVNSSIFSYVPDYGYLSMNNNVG